MFEGLAPPGWALYEPCAGSAALSMHLLGMKRSLMPYQGSKWRYRRELEWIIRRHGFVGKPDRFILSDPGPWGEFWEYVGEGDLLAVLTGLRRLTEEDPREVYDELMKGEEKYLHTPADFLFLQRLSFSGKAVTYSGKRDRFGGRLLTSPGFNKTSAYGAPATDKFGEVRPMIPSLIERLEELGRLLDPYIEMDMEFPLWGDRDSLQPALPSPGPNSVVYIDPPYAETTGYGDTLPREEVVEFALRMNERPHVFVMVSEAEPIQELIDLGWKAVKISEGRGGESSFKSKKEEWVTHNGTD